MKKLMLTLGAAATVPTSNIIAPAAFPETPVDQESPESSSSGEEVSRGRGAVVNHWCSRGHLA